MGGFNQAQAHAQFVSDVVDFGLDVQQALEVGRFTKDRSADATSTSKRSSRRAVEAGRARPSSPHGAAAIGHVRLRPGCRERRHGRALRGLGAASRRRGDS